METLEETTNLAKLPAFCYALYGSQEPGDRIVMVIRGVHGFFSTNFDSLDATFEIAFKAVERLNEGLGVTAAQRLAMVAGAMEGFDSPAADPDLYRRRVH